METETKGWHKERAQQVWKPAKKKRKEKNSTGADYGSTCISISEKGHYTSQNPEENILQKQRQGTKVLSEILFQNEKRLKECKLFRIQDFKAWA